MPRKVIDIENLSDDTDNESYKSDSEPERLTKTIKKIDKPKKVLSDKQKAVLEGARKKRMENIEAAKKNKKIEAAKILIENETNLKIKDKVKETVEEKPKKTKKKTIIIESESESSSEEEQIVIKKKKSNKPKRVVKEESEEESEEEVIRKPKQRQFKPQISTQTLNKLNIFDGFV